MKLKSTLGLEHASAILDKALDLGRQEGMKPLTVVVLDAGGRMVAMKSEDGSGLVRFNIAFGKAWGALGMGMPSRQTRDYLSARPVFQTSIAVASDGRFVPVPGGTLIEDAEGFVIGAVGISGDASEKDEYCGVMAIRHAGLTPNPREVDPNWRDASLSDKH